MILRAWVVVRVFGWAVALRVNRVSSDASRRRMASLSSLVLRSLGESGSSSRAKIVSVEDRVMVEGRVSVGGDEVEVPSSVFSRGFPPSGLGEGEGGGEGGGRVGGAS